jgi:hypothetical protein
MLVVFSRAWVYDHYERYRVFQSNILDVMPFEDMFYPCTLDTNHVGVVKRISGIGMEHFGTELVMYNNF